MMPLRRQRGCVKKLLIVEDDVAIAETLRVAAESAGIDSVWAKSGDDALRIAGAGDIATAVVDVNLPGISGFEVCRRLREQSADVSILILTSRDSDEDRLHGFRVGCDDYVTKPFSIRELSARMRILMRRFDDLRAAEANGPRGQLPVMRFAELDIDPGDRTVARSGEPIRLTYLEFEVLLYLAYRAGQAVSREELARSVWDYRHADTDALVTSLLSRLRQAIEPDPAVPRFVLTVRGFGYRFAGPDEL